MQIFAVINNLTDRDPPVTGNSSSNPLIYDIIGRAYRVRSALEVLNLGSFAGLAAAQLPVSRARRYGF